MLSENTLHSVKSKPITIKSRSYKIFDETSFKHDIDAIPWQYIVSLDDPINAWQIWKKNYFLMLLISMLQSNKEE
jgi:hypothetical protein